MDTRVACDCNGLRASGIFEVDGEWLVLRSTLGDHRVRLGVAHPRKLAARLMKNLCSKAATKTLPNAIEPPSLSDKAQERIDAQRDKSLAMDASDPRRATEERILDQMITNARGIDTAVQSLAPITEKAARTPRATASASDVEIGHAATKPPSPAS